MQSPDLLERYQKLSATPGSGTPPEVAAFIKEETRRWSEVIRSVGIQPE
jgi:tripartite-type tricarboxylate transporter receptor subunit TctC